MFEYWEKLSQDEIDTRIQSALDKNVNYDKEHVLGIPASYLDEKIFNQDASFLKDAPYMKTLVQNPNHIGCHTLGDSESYFRGTQQIEKELIEICAVDILKGEIGKQDGYVASGGTEANLQAIWIYRNFFRNNHAVESENIGILCSEDSHYCVDKAADIFSLDLFKVPVDAMDRQVSEASINKTIKKAKSTGVSHFIVIVNMMTTMFGSIDNIEAYTNALNSSEVQYKIHVDGAFGGFYYPFVNGENVLSFKNKEITSFTLDAHKMAQAPYGTGIFVIRKGMLQYANTREASYVEGEDSTLIGSRSGANAIAVWMILVKNGPFGWREKIYILQKRTEWMCDQLKELNVDYYRDPHSNIITIHKNSIKKTLAQKYGLVPDNHKDPEWFKIVVMEHVTIEKLLPLIEEMQDN